MYELVFVGDFLPFVGLNGVSIEGGVGGGRVPFCLLGPFLSPEVEFIAFLQVVPVIVREGLVLLTPALDTLLMRFQLAVVFWLSGPVSLDMG